MNKSRYAYTNIITGAINNNMNNFYSRQATWSTISSEDTHGKDDQYHTFTSTDRLDVLSAKYYGDGRYWWIICLANNISSPFDKNLTPGKVLRIPSNTNKILNAIKLNSKKD